MKKLLFLVRFLVSFALLLWAWSASGIAPAYTRAMLALAGVLGPITHGWMLQPVLPDGPQHPVWVHGTARVDLTIQFDQLAIGLVPMIALFLATPGVPPLRRIRQIALGVLLSYLCNAAILAAFPLLVFYKNDFTDVFGTFVGMVGFVGLPAILWFALAFEDVRPWLPSFAPRPAATP